MPNTDQLQTSTVTSRVSRNTAFLGDRIARLVDLVRPAVRTRLGPVVVVIAVLLATAPYGLFGQSGTNPAVASCYILLHENSSVELVPGDRRPGHGASDPARLRSP